MDWESKFSSIVRETETNLVRVRDRLGSGRRKTKAFPDRSSGNHFGVGNLDFQATRSPFKSSKAWDSPTSLHSPVKTVGIATSVPSSQVSPALLSALFERVEEQAEMVNQLSDAVKKILKEKEAHAAEIKKMNDEIISLNDRLRERGVDLETERKLEQFKHDIFSQLDLVRNQTKLSPDAVGKISGFHDSVVMNEAKRMIEEETESLQRIIEHLKTRLGKMELELHSTVSDSRDVLHKQERLDRALSSLSENQHSQSRSLSRIVDERQSDSYEIQQLKHLVNKVSSQCSELETELQSSFRHSGVSSSNSSVRWPRPPSSHQTRMTNGASKPKIKGVIQKSKGASDDLVVSSSSDTDLSLTTLDASSLSDTDLASLQLDRSYAGAVPVPTGASGYGIGNISSSSLSSLDSDDLLK